MKLCYGCMEQYEEALSTCPHCGYAEDTPPESAMHMEPGTILADRYVIGKVIGYGGFGVTYLGFDAVLNMKVAIKEYLPSEFSTRMAGQTAVTVFEGDKHEQFTDGREKFVDEAKRLAQFSNADGIVKIYDSFEHNNTAYIIMEVLEGETLAERLKRDKTIPESEAIGLMMPMISSLEQIHKTGIIHRDIAPDNIFLTKAGQVKLIDFGAARFATTSHSRSLTVIIKPGYSPEEQYRSRGDQGPHTDVYAVAAVCYRMLTGQVPPDALERRAMVEGKKKDTIKEIVQLCPDISDNTAAAVMNALNVRIEDRTPDMATFREELTSTAPVKRRVGKIRAIDLYRWPLWAKISIPTAAAALVVFLVLFFTGVIGFDANLKTEYTVPDGQARVPSVINDLLNDGEERLTDAQLSMEILGKVYSEQIPADYIMIQNIQGGAVVPLGTIVGLTVSGGVVEYEVPDVLGMQSEQANETLAGMGFVVQLEEAYHDTLAAGLVAEQSVAAGEMLAEGETIVLTVSKGRDPEMEIEIKEVTVPDFVGKTYTEALQLAGESGLQVNISERKYSKDVPKDTVMAQTPKAGEKITTDQQVSIVISLGFEQISVPDVVLMTKEKATALLTGYSFKVEVIEQNSETIAAGLVISQTPEAEAKADPESTVQLVVSTGAAAFDMPDVTGMQFDEAIALLVGKGLAVNIVYEQNNARKENEVLRQSISEGTQVKRGQTVTLTFCSHSKTISVPDVVGKTESAATSAITGAGLKVLINEVYDNSVAEGKVISQYPTAGTSLNEGGTVTLNISLGKDPSVVTTTTKVTTTKKATTTTTKATTQTTTTTTTTVDNSEALDYLRYNIAGGEVTITGCSRSASGVLEIPSMIEGYPVTSIGEDAFSYCDKLTSITIPSSVTSIGHLAFEDCDSLTSITIPNSVTSIGDYAFYTCDSLTSITIPNSVTSIGDCAFSNCINLTSITIPNSVTSIGRSAFYCCNSLTSITIPSSVTSIGVAAFLACNSLTSITIPDSVTSIGEEAFYWCHSLTSITIPNSVTSIGGSAFYGCDSLTSITIPNSVTSIGDCAFADCYKLTSINVDANNAEYSSIDGVLYSKGKTKIICYPAGKTATSYTIPDSVTSIGVRAFSWCKSLTSITIPNSVTSIGADAFLCCFSLTDVYYDGTEEQWNAISIGADNSNLTEATIHFNS